MENILLFSGKFKKLRINLQFLINKCWKIIILAFKWNKNIKLEQLSYLKEWRFDKSYLIIHFSFRNVIWYQLKNIRRINCLKPIILNLENIAENQVEFIVYGFFRQKTYLIDISKTETLIANDFKTEINNINIIEQISNSFKLKLKKPLVLKQNITLESNDIETNIKPIIINLNIFNQKEFI